MTTLRETTGVLRLRLWVAGKGPNSELARENISRICIEYFTDAFELEVVDLLECPMQALADGIVVTPTLLKLAPAPTQRIIGNLNDCPQVVLALQTV